MPHNNFSHRAVLATITMAAFLLCHCSDKKENHPAAQILWPVDQAKTQQYIENLDPTAIELRGSDFLNPRFDPERIGYTVNKDDGCGYDYAMLAEVEEKLEGVDRQQALKGLFDLVTKDAKNNKQRHLAMLKFLHRASYHSHLRPMYEDCTRCWDPLVLLEVNEMHCTHAARVVYDIWKAAGHDARLVQFGIKCSAEVYYDDAWHYFGADSVGGNGIVLLNDDGTIPSWKQLSENPGWIDALPYRYELRVNGGIRKNGSPYRSIHCFHNSGGNGRYYKFKKDTPLSGEFNYGWEDYAAIPGDWNYKDRPYLYQPGPPSFERVELEPSQETGSVKATITWSPSIDVDGDLIGYRVYVGSKSRNWSYQRWSGNKKTKPFWATDTGWKPEMYDALYQMPPHDVDLIQTEDTQVTLELDPSEIYYITIMAFDAHGEEINKEMYLQSNEIKIETPGD